MGPHRILGRHRVLGPHGVPGPQRVLGPHRVLGPVFLVCHINLCYVYVNFKGINQNYLSSQIS